MLSFFSVRPNPHANRAKSREIRASRGRPSRPARARTASGAGVSSSSSLSRAFSVAIATANWLSLKSCVYSLPTRFSARRARRARKVDTKRMSLDDAARAPRARRWRRVPVRTVCSRFQTSSEKRSLTKSLLTTARVRYIPCACLKFHYTLRSKNEL